MTAVKDDDQLLCLDRPQRLGELRARDGGGRVRLGESGVGLESRVDGQQILAGIRSGPNAAAVAGDVDQHG